MKWIDRIHFGPKTSKLIHFPVDSKICFKMRFFCTFESVFLRTADLMQSEYDFLLADNLNHYY